MAATFTWCEDNGPERVTTEGASGFAWKSVDDATTTPEQAPIVAGRNSFDKWRYGKFTGSFTSLSAGLFAHVKGRLPRGVGLIGPESMSADRDRLRWRRPSTETNEDLVTIMTEPGLIESGVRVWFGPRTPDAPGKAPMSESNPAYTNYLTTQLVVDGSALEGEIGPVVFTLRYDEQ